MGKIINEVFGLYLLFAERRLQSRLLGKYLLWSSYRRHDHDPVRVKNDSSLSDNAAKWMGGDSDFLGFGVVIGHDHDPVRVKNDSSLSDGAAKRMGGDF